MAAGAEVRLLGERLSPYCIRVQQALAVKGVAEIGRASCRERVCLLV